ncbi:MAG: hypothetical protein ACI82G_002863, partial [Bradymonadia bacterium]
DDGAVNPATPLLTLRDPVTIVRAISTLTPDAKHGPTVSDGFAAKRL